MRYVFFIALVLAIVVLLIPTRDRSWKKDWFRR
jgi:hypothetical protein